MIAWIQFKDEYMINARRTPAVCIDAKQEDKQDDEEHATVHAQCRMPVHHAVVHSTHTTFSLVNFALQLSTAVTHCTLVYSIS